MQTHVHTRLLLVYQVLEDKKGYYVIMEKVAGQELLCANGRKQR